MKREELKNIAQETLEAVKNGGYTVLGKEVKLHKVEKGIFYGSEELGKLSVDECKKYKSTVISITDESTVEAIFRLRENGIGVLNFASAYHPGGGFLNGRTAQEESLAYCSNLYDTLVGNRIYEENSKVKTKMYTDNMVIGNVEFFRTPDFKYVLEPKTVKVLTSPAVNMGEVLKKWEDETKAKEVMKNRMRKILKLFAHDGCKALVLGAFGCGVFKNRPKDVAEFWMELLVEEELAQLFKNIVFAIHEKPGKRGNYEIFEDVIVRGL